MTERPEFAALRVSLTSDCPSIEPRWLYDDSGSALFDRITELPEYYPTRVERQLLLEHGEQIARASGCRNVAEIGSGASDKTRALIAGFAHAGLLASFTALDVNADAARRTSATLALDWPDAEFRWLAADFMRTLPEMELDSGNLLAFLGGTIGNLDARERGVFLERAWAALRPGDAVLLGIDLVKSAERLHAAYDDAAGVTSAFILNGLHHVNAAAGGDFVLDEWEYAPRWDPENNRMDMRLRSSTDQTVHIDAIDLELRFRAGDEILMEISSKFTVAGMQAELAGAGFEPRHAWIGRDHLGASAGEDDFALLLAIRP